MRILVAEHDQAVAQSIELMLKSESFNVYTTDHGGEAVDLGKLYDYDAILLGETPELTRCDMLKSLRTAKVKSSILVLSRSRRIEDTVQVLGLGADDCMITPFHKDELVARIHALVRRCKGHAQSIITTGPLTLNINTKTITVSGQPIHLTGKEYAILELLSLRKGMTLSKAQFLNHLYGGMDEPESKIVDVFICKLRRKLADVNEGDGIIETVWGRGYVLRDPVTPTVKSPSLAPEIADMIDDPPTGYVSRKSFMEKRREDIAAGRVKAPSIVPAAGQR